MIQKAYNTLLIMITASSTDDTEMNFLKEGKGQKKNLKKSVET